MVQSTVWYSTVQYSTVQYGTVQYSKVQRVDFYFTMGTKCANGQRVKRLKGQNVIEAHSRLGHLKNISHPSLFPEEGPSCLIKYSLSSWTGPGPGSELYNIWFHFNLSYLKPSSLPSVAMILLRQEIQTVCEQDRSFGQCSPPSYLHRQVEQVRNDSLKSS